MSVHEGKARPLNEDVVVHLAVRNQNRQVTVTREALEDFLHLSPMEAAQFTVQQRCDRVQKNLPAVIAAVNRKIDRGSPTANDIVIFAGEL
jgi:hypothetical protein